MPELATKTTQLFAELDVLRSKPKIDAFTLKRLEHEAKKLLSVDAFSGYQLLGALSSFSGRVSEMRENYDKALKLASTPAEKSVALNNYSASLLVTGYFAESVELVFQALNLDAGDLHKLNFALSCYKSGSLHQAIQHIENLARLDQDLSQQIIAVVKFMDEHGVRDEELQKMIEIAISVLHARNFFNFRNMRTAFVSDEDSTWFCYVIKVDRSVEEVVDMRYELAGQLAEVDLPMNLLSNFLVTYECAEEEYGSD
jgi:tetratricopeptide (TPR) repeat protein